MMGEKKMRYKSFLIKNYKAIEEQHINLEEQNLYPIIGLNETGKSTILQAIFAFDLSNDKFYNGEHVNYQMVRNRYLRGDITPEIEAVVESLDLEEYNMLIQKISFELIKKNENNLFSYIKDKNVKDIFYSRYKGEFINVIRNKISEKLSDILSSLKMENIEINRILEPKLTYFGYKIKNVNFSKNFITEIGEIRIADIVSEVRDINIPGEELEATVVKCLLEELPKIIYIDDFRDKIPREINKTMDWYKYIVQIIKEYGFEIENFEKIAYEELLSDISEIAENLNEDVMKLWDEMHQVNKIKNEFETVKIELHYEKGIFKFLIKDMRKESKEGRKKNIYFPLDERSKGFQWFFNFFIKVRYNWKYNSDDKYGSIILLDEPGVYLHTDFQKELTKVLNQISKNKNKVFYSTHLENLVDPDCIPPKLIRIAKREKEKVKLYKYNECSDDTSELGELAPLINAFKLKSYPSSFRNEKIILTEGPSEQSFFKLLQESKLLLDKIIIIPGAGCSNLSTLISLISGFSEKYTVLLDGDAKKDFEKYKEEFGEEEARKWILHHIEGSEKSELEDYYSEGVKKY